MSKPNLKLVSCSEDLDPDGEFRDEIRRVLPHRNLTEKQMNIFCALRNALERTASR